MTDLTWKVTLSDLSIKEEGTHTFDLAWEDPGRVNKIEILGADKPLSCDLIAGLFTIGSDTKIVSVVGPKGLYFRKRRQVRTDGAQVIESRTTYVFGFRLKDVVYSAAYRPALETISEEWSLPE